MAGIKVVDLTKEHDIPMMAVARGGGGASKYELKDYGVTTIDGITFSFLNPTYEGQSYFGHEISFKEGEKEIHVIVAQEKNGVVVAVNMISDVKIEGDMKTGHLRAYSMIGKEVRKTIDGTYEGRMKNFSKVDDLMGFIKKGDHRSPEFKKSLKRVD